MEKQQIIVTCAAGVESVTKKELRDLGFVAPKANDGKITLLGTAEDIAVLNMFLRTGERVLLALDTFDAPSFDELFDKVKAYPWSDILPFNARILVNGKSKKSQLFHINSCCSIVKKAILRCLSEKYRRSSFPENGETYRVEFFINENVVTLALDTSGAGLHKRGYRDLVGKAPIKETLACALIDLSGFTPDRAFCDPFCGSGTIVIEAARKALGIAPGIDRAFDYASWDFLDGNAHYRTALEMAKAAVKTDVQLRMYGFDIDKNAVSLASRHAMRAGVSDYVHLQVQDVSKFSSRYKGGYIVTNPPYGERLLDLKKANELYGVLGSVWRNLDNWGMYVITAAPQFEKYFGKKCDKTRKLFNANIECRFYEYPPK